MQVGGNDGDTGEMDEDEFEFAITKMSTILRVSVEDLCEAGLAEDAKNKGLLLLLLYSRYRS